VLANTVRTRRLTWLLRLGLPAVIGLGTLVAGAAPALADTGWTVQTGGANLNLRSGPGTGYPVIGSLANGTTVHVYCTEWGTTVRGNSSWDYLGGGRFAADALIYTGADMSAPLCSDAHQSTMEIDPTGTCGGSLGGGAAGVFFTKAADWYEYVPSYHGCTPHDPRYYWTGGNGVQVSGDYFQWLYYAGAYATCDIKAYIPPNDASSQHVKFNSDATYSIWTGRGITSVLGVTYINQVVASNSPGPGPADLGTFHADGSGIFAIRLDDSSPSKYGSGNQLRVVAASMLFSCTQKKA
jgi:hypothetical protein